jgi:acyl transferase domain-containing protein
LLSASGIAGLIKVLLSISAKQLPPTLHCDQPNSRFNFEDSLVYPVRSLEEWKGVDGILRAGVSAFGLGGNNAHVLVSNAGVPKEQQVVMPLPSSAVLFKRSRYWLAAQAHVENRLTIQVNEDGIDYKKSFDKYLEAEITKREEVWHITLELDHHNYILRDHRVHGVRIIPGVTYLDLVLRYAQELFKEVFELKKVLFTEPLATSSKFNRRLVLRFIEKQPTGYHVVVHSQKVNAKREAIGAWSEHMRCEVVPLEASLEETSFDIADFIKNSDHQIAVSEVYKSARELSIVHGVFMQPKGRIYQKGNQELMALSLEALAEHHRHYFMAHPAFLDSATFSGSSFNIRPHNGMLGVSEPYIPFSIAHFKMYQKLPEEVYVLGHKRSVSKGKELPEVYQSDLKVYDASGVLLAEFSGLTLKRIRHPELIQQLISENSAAHKKEKKEPKTKNLLANHAITEHQEEAVRVYLRQIIGEKLEEVVTPDQDAVVFYELGLDSKQLMSLVRQLEQKCKHELYPTLLFEYQTIEELARYLWTQDKEHFNASLETINGHAIEEV